MSSGLPQSEKAHGHNYEADQALPHVSGLVLLEKEVHRDKNKHGPSNGQNKSADFEN